MIDFCFNCGSWVGPEDGVIIAGPDGPETLCGECSALLNGRACPPRAGSRSGLLLGNE